MPTGFKMSRRSRDRSKRRFTTHRSSLLWIYEHSHDVQPRQYITSTEQHRHLTIDLLGVMKLDCRPLSKKKGNESLTGLASKIPKFPNHIDLNTESMIILYTAMTNILKVVQYVGSFSLYFLKINIYVHTYCMWIFTAISKHLSNYFLYLWFMSS